MKTKIKYLLVLVLASFVFAGCTTTINGSCKAKQWEYKTAVLNSRADINVLNQLGSEGWMLVSVIATDNQDLNCVYYFKRPKQ